jgi:mono/diheme cytochrome c family protein
MTTKVKHIFLPTFALGALAVALSAPNMLPGAAAQDAKALYIQKCSSCHASDGSGNTTKGKQMKLKDLRSPEVQKLTDAKLYEITANGVKKGSHKMDGYEKTLGKEKVQMLVAYMRQMANK